MSDTIDIEIGLLPAGDTTEREIAQLANELRELLWRRPEVLDVASVGKNAPDGAKAASEVAAFSAFLLQLAPPAVEQILNIANNFLKRRPSPTEVVIKLKDAKISFKYDPRSLTPDEVGIVAQKLRAAL